MMPLQESEIGALGAGNVVVRDGWLGRNVALAAHADAQRAAERSRTAGVGLDGNLDEHARGDAVLWLDRADALPGLIPLHDAFDSLRTDLNNSTLLGLATIEVSLTRYPGGGARYQRQRDAFGEGDSRIITAIYYLNPTWSPADGGELLVHGQKGLVTLAPLLDRLVMFLSSAVEHEVLPVMAPRLAVTAWYSRTRPVPS